METEESEPDADRKEECRVIMDLRIEAPPLAAVIAARCQFRIWSKVSAQRSTWQNVQGRIVFQPASSQDDPLALPVHDLCFVFLFKAPIMDAREISTQNNRSHIAMSCNSPETWKASPNLRTVADLQARPRSEIALISRTAGRCE